MNDTRISAQENGKALSHSHLSIIEALKQLTWWPRLIMLCIILLISVGITIECPGFLVEYFVSSGEGALIQLLTRIWISASLAATLVLSLAMYLNILKRISRDNKEINDPDRLERVERLQRNSALIVLALFGLIVIVGFLIAQSSSQLALINLLAGVVLVSMILVLDINLSMISEELLSEAESKAQSDVQISPENLCKWRDRFLSDRDVVIKLDIPILIGITFTWILGYMILPQVLDEVAIIYAHGFATGSTALQLIVGNIAFEIISASTSV